MNNGGEFKEKYFKHCTGGHLTKLIILILIGYLFMKLVSMEHILGAEVNINLRSLA